MRCKQIRDVSSLALQSFINKFGPLVHNFHLHGILFFHIENFRYAIFSLLALLKLDFSHISLSLNIQNCYVKVQFYNVIVLALKRAP